MVGGRGIAWGGREGALTWLFNTEDPWFLSLHRLLCQRCMINHGIFINMRGDFKK